MSVAWLGRWPRRIDIGVFPNAFVRGVGLRFPILSVELLYLQAREVYAFEAAHVDHVLRGVGSRPKNDATPQLRQKRWRATRVPN